jgi:hypothetical protein
MTFLRRVTSFIASGIDRAIDRFVAHFRWYRALTLREARRRRRALALCEARVATAPGRRRALALCEARVATAPEGSDDAVVYKSMVVQHRRAVDVYEGDARFAAFLLRLPVVRSHRRPYRPGALAPPTRE